jgi:hypothetical protein
VFQKLHVQFASVGAFRVVARQDVDVDVIVADVTEDGVAQTARAQRVPVQTKQARKASSGTDMSVDTFR